MGERHSRGGLNSHSDRDATWQSRAGRTAWRGTVSLVTEQDYKAFYGTREEQAASFARLMDVGSVLTNPCWCHGDLCIQYGKWLGLDEGLPHPKDKEELALRVEKRLEMEQP